MGNYVGRNFVSSAWYANGGTTGTGIWINWESSGALVFGNRTSGAPENGLTIFNASKAEFRGNTTSANGEGGIFIYGPGRLVNEQQSGVHERSPARQRIPDRELRLRPAEQRWTQSPAGEQRQRFP